VHLDGRVIDVGEIAHRQRPVSGHAKMMIAIMTSAVSDWPFDE
jgi:hypothetical protein